MTTASLPEMSDALRFANDRIALDIDARTGRWRALTDQSTGRVAMHDGHLLAPLLLTVGGHTQASRGFQQMFSVADAETIGLRWQLDGFETREADGATWLVVRLAEGDWRAEIHYGLRDGSARLERRLAIRYDGEGEALLRSLLLRQPYAVVERPAEWYVEAPGYPVRPNRRVSALPYGCWGQLAQGAFNDAPAWRPPLLGLHRPGDTAAFPALLAWAHTETEPLYPVVERGDRGILIGHRIYLADRFRAGHELQWGAQYVELFTGEWMEALANFQRFYAEVGLTVPADTPDWARAIDMYEVHVGTLSGTGLAPFPTFEPLIEELPRIRDKGFDAVYLMPHVPFPSYSVIDYFDMDVQQGSDSGFRAFVRRSHELGLKVFIDVTLHGVMDRRARRMLQSLEGRSAESYPMEPAMPEEHPYLAANPEWFSRNETGAIAMTYTYAFDHASPSWQDFMASVFRYYVQEYDVDGFRVDSHTWNFFPNWAPDLPYPASASFYGSAQLFKRIRRELKEIKPGVVLYTETAGPLLHTSHELGYNYDETWLLLSTLPVATRRGLLCHFAHPAHITTERMTARHIAYWLAQRRLAMPPGAVKVHHLDSHDAYWGAKEFRRNTFGPATRAVVAFYAFIDGGFMDYHGADEGYEGFYRRVMHLRRTCAPLRHGSCDYMTVKPGDEMVFAPLREHEGKYAVPVINFDGCATRTTLPLPIETMALPAERYAVVDRMTDEVLPGPAGAAWRRDELAQLTVDLSPYGVRLLELG